MPAETKGRRKLLWAIGILCLALASLHVYSTKAMDSLPAAFTIEINGTPIAKVGADAPDKTQAQLGTEPAVFELKNKRLQSDGHFLARTVVEDRSFLPKQVWWFKPDTDILMHHVVATQDGASYQLKFANAGLMASDDGAVFADLLGDNPSTVAVKMLA